MKINGISVGEYRASKHLNLNGLTSGLNLVFGRNGSGKSTLTQYIRNVLFGFGGVDVAHGGSLEMEHQGNRYLVERNTQTTDRMQVRPRDQYAGSMASGRDQWTLPLNSDVFDAAYVLRGRLATEPVRALVSTLRDQLQVPVGDSRARVSEVRSNASQAEELRAQLKRLDQQVAGLKTDRVQLEQQFENDYSTSSTRRAELESQIRDIESRINSSQQLHIRDQIQTLETEIAELRLVVERSRNRVVEVDSTSPTQELLVVLFRRLDEVDNQIQRWRNVHMDIQQQRVALKDEMLVWNEMTLDTVSHPYHRSQEILRQIETQVGFAENTASQLTDTRPDEVVDQGVQAEQLLGCCRQIREGLYSLCDELGTQYKTIRHQRAATELKRLRRCYNEISENITSLVDHRRQLVEEIRLLDPAGAEAILRANSDFCQCANHDGYWVAREKFVGQWVAATPRVQQPDVSVETMRLRELESLRADRVKELVAIENQLGQLRSEQETLKGELHRLPVVNRQDLQTRLDQTTRELESLAEERRRIERELNSVAVQTVPTEHPAINFASQLASRLTLGEVRRVWLAPGYGDASGIEVEDRHGNRLGFEQLGSGMQQQVVLGCSLAVVDHYRRSGAELPMLLDDVFVNLDPKLIGATYDVLVDFTRSGQQVIAFTADQSVVELAHQHRTTVLDLPDTSVSPTVPLWSPERSPLPPPREPEFLTPFTTRAHQAMVTEPLRYPQVKYPAAGNQIDYSAANFEEPRIEQTRAVVKSIDVASDLRTLGVLERDALEALGRRGIHTANDLLQITPTDIPVGIADSHLSSAVIDQCQSLVWMLICVPELDSSDARLLHAIGITEPEQLETTNGQQLFDRISRFLDSSQGRGFANSRQRIGRDQIGRWYDALNSTRSQWRLPSGYSRRSNWTSAGSNSRSSSRANTGANVGASSNYQRQSSQSARPEYQSRSAVRSSENRESIALGLREQTDRERRRSRSSRSRRSDSDERASYSERRQRPERLTERRTEERESRTRAPRTRETLRTVSASSSGLKFYLELSDQLEAAPSIGPKTAERFAGIGVRTVSEFLAQTAESMAPKLNYKRITADVIRQWQHQARMVSRVPNLRGHDAQMLVACGIIEPEDLADMGAEKLFAIIKPFAETKEGLKIIRGGKQPDLEEITDWIAWAQETRSLQAA